jgi:hypothetical protein
MKGTKGSVRVDYIGGKLGLKAFGALARLKENMAAEGATEIHIDTTPIIERSGMLMKYLTRSGFMPRTNGTMFYDGRL